MTSKLRLVVSAAIAALLTLITLPIIFNLLPGAARIVAPVVCKGTFVIHESGRRRGHEYLCDSGAGEPTDVTFAASALTSGLTYAAWFAAAYGGLWLRARRGEP
jgi:hypothetical protein